MSIKFLNQQDFTIHTHTHEFDGRNSSAEMIDRARAVGFRTIGISNHFIVHPMIKRTKLYGASVAGGYSSMYSSDFDEALAKFIPHYAELEQLRDKNPDMQILRGLEVDYFPTPQWADGFARACEILKPDYLIGSAHFVEYAGTVCNVHDMAILDDKTQDEMLKIYWSNVRRLAGAGMFNFLAHIDLPKKKGLGLKKKWTGEWEDTIVAIAESRTPIEINTSGYKIGTGEPYPGPKILELAKLYHVPMFFSDDAHHVDQLGRCMDDAYIMAKNCGISNFASLQKILDFRGKKM